MSYLTEKLASYYLEAYQYSKHCEDEVWKLNKELVEYLNKINSSKHIRTLYSRSDTGTSNLDKNSYLAFCYTKESENYIETVFESKLKAEFKENVILKFRKTKPIITKKTTNTNPELKYVLSSDYRNVWLYHILIRGDYNQKHFWKFITNELTNIYI